LKRIFTAFLTVMLCAGLIPHAGASEAVGTMRVGLHYGNGVLNEASISNADGAGFTAGCYDGRNFVSRTTISGTRLRVTASGSTITVSDAGTGAAVYTGTDSNLALRPNGEQIVCQEHNYKGDIVFTASGGQLTVMNYVSLEDYVRGVLPYEMTPSWPTEALKAQAVCARSYALSSVNKHQSRYGFDVCDGTDCQVYQGTTRATGQSDSAVQATEGEYLVHNGKLAAGYFFSSDGGATEDAVNVWGNEIGYLKGVPDPYEDLDNAANGRWSKTLTASEVAEKLRSAGYSIGTVKNISITKRTPMDNVNEVTITDTAGSKVVLKRQACRAVFNVNSIRYSINGDSGAAPEKSESSSNSNTSATSNPTNTTETQPQPQQPSTVYISGTSALGPAPRFSVGALGALNPLYYIGASYFATTTSFTFTGTGWGHNVGMSQYGAKGMAEQGFNYREILSYYFTDIEISK